MAVNGDSFEVILSADYADYADFKLGTSKLSFHLINLRNLRNLWTPPLITNQDHI